ncbi:transcriptional regulator [Pseudonocardiaceae bacterium YIM PH 21723]|nr:transcriptional regulator [Pseudonocardiaceae bacterium YIM PH 21723]
MATRGTHSTKTAEWIEQVAAFFVEDGLPLISGRILGYLLICEPAERTAAELGAALDASSGSISTNVRALIRLGLVSKTTRRGREAALYRIEEQRWERMLKAKLDRIAATRQLTAAGLRLLSGNSERAARLRHVDELYGWLGDELTGLWDRRGNAASRG